MDASVVPADCAVLGNGTYSVLLTASMDGYAKKNNLYLTRFRRTPMAQGIGIFLAEGDAAKREDITVLAPLPLFTADGTPIDA